MDYLKKQYNQAKNDRRRRSEDQSKVPSSSANPARAQEPLRPATSKPAPPASPFDRLKALSAELQAIISSFKPPASDVDLEWQAKASVESPKLAFNSVNAPVHAYEDGLMKLLIKLDGVESGGDARIRDERKRLVRSVEAELSRLDEWKASRWQQSHERDGARDRLVPEEGPRLDESKNLMCACAAGQLISSVDGQIHHRGSKMRDTTTTAKGRPLPLTMTDASRGRRGQM